MVEFDPSTDGVAELREAFRRGVADFSGWYREYYERNLDDETRPFPIDPAGPRVVLVPGIGIITSATTRAGHGSRATSTTAPSRCRTRPMPSAASAR